MTEERFIELLTPYLGSPIVCPAVHPTRDNNSILVSIITDYIKSANDWAYIIHLANGEEKVIAMHNHVNHIRNVASKLRIRYKKRTDVTEVLMGDYPLFVVAGKFTY